MASRRTTNFIAGTGISVAESDNNATGQQDVTITNTAPSTGGTVSSVGAGTGMSVTGTSSAPIVNVAASGVGAGTYGDTSHYATVTVDATGRVTGASQIALPSGPGFAWVTSGGAFEAFGAVLGGDVSQGTHSLGFQPLEVVGLLNHALPSLTTGFLNWTGSAWALTAGTSSVTVTGGAGIQVTGGPAYTAAIAAATAHSVMTTGAGTGGFTAVAPGAAGSVLTSNGSSVDPSYQPIPAVQLPVSPQYTNHSVSLTGATQTTVCSVSVTTPNDGVTRSVVLIGGLNVANTNLSTSWTLTWGFGVNGGGYSFTDSATLLSGGADPNRTVAHTFVTTQAPNTTVTYQLAANLSSGASGVTAFGSLTALVT